MNLEDLRSKRRVLLIISLLLILIAIGVFVSKNYSLGAIVLLVGLVLLFIFTRISAVEPPPISDEELKRQSTNKEELYAKWRRRHEAVEGSNDFQEEGEQEKYEEKGLETMKEIESGVMVGIIRALAIILLINGILGAIFIYGFGAIVSLLIPPVYSIIFGAVLFAVSFILQT